MAYVKEFTHAEHASNTRAAERFIKDNGLTGPQMEVLRNAARPWQYRGISKNRTPHDGQVSFYGVMDKTIAKLREEGYIADEYEHSEEKRAALYNEAEALIVGAWDITNNPDPFRRIEDQEGILAWRAALVDLRLAEGKLKARDVKVTRITAKGREVVAEFLGLLGIVED